MIKHFFGMLFSPIPTKKEQMAMIYFFISFSLSSKINKHLYVQLTLL